MLRLRSRLGTIVEPDRLAEGHYVVRLDRPARYDDGVNAPRSLSQVVEAADNLEVLDSAPQ
jgi:hypothetical protein